MALNGKIAVVTGAGRGIGRAIAVRLARDGAMVVVNYQKNQQAATAVVHEIEQAGGKAFALQGDMGSVEDIRQFFQILDDELGRRHGNSKFDILVNNAGIFSEGTVESMSEAEFDRTFSVDVKGPFFVSQLAIPRLSNGGRIINISSGASQHPSPNHAAYCMAKAAVNMLSMVLAAELGKRGITANTVAPGLTSTDMTSEVVRDTHMLESFVSRTALGRVGEPDDIADVVAFLASNDSRWITGQYIEASGGLTLV